MWDQPYEPHPDYGVFKGRLYSQLDPRFEAFFPKGVASSIRLDEVEWGGVAVNGIPPLEYPNRLDAASADYLGGRAHRVRSCDGRRGARVPEADSRLA